MRRVAAALLVASTVLTPAVALAAPRDAADREMAAMADKLNDPKMQAGIAGMMTAMADMMMSMRIDGLRDAVAKIDPDAARKEDDWGNARTLGEAVERSDPHYREKMAAGSRAAVGAMGSMATGMAAMMPQLREMAEHMGKEVERATRNLPR